MIYVTVATLTDKKARPFALLQAWRTGANLFVPSINMFVPSVKAAPTQPCGQLGAKQARAAQLQTCAVEDIRSIVARLPQRELDIRRRWSRDAQFRSACKDYAEAARALRYWQHKEAEGGGRMVEEYNELVDELEAEILMLLDRPIPNFQCS